jgi:hypothetical protein
LRFSFMASAAMISAANASTLLVGQVALLAAQ